jgi:hypothetical protein
MIDKERAPNTPLTSEELARWVLFGARWRLVHLAGDHAVIDLCTCDGQPVERRITVDAKLVDELRSGAPDLG